jgi:hypothetical protein
MHMPRESEERENIHSNVNILITWLNCLKIIYLTHNMFDSVFTVVFNTMRRIKLDLTYICLKYFFNINCYPYINNICYQIYQHNLLLRP